MKRKAIKRKTETVKPALAVDPLRDLGCTQEWIQTIESLASSAVIFCGWHDGTNAPIIRARESVEGVPLPIDLEPALNAFARRAGAQLTRRLSNPPVACESGEQAFSPVILDALQSFFVEDSLRTMVRLGFYLAVLRYADDLKHVPEAAAMIAREQARAETARRNGKARAKQAAPTHKVIQKRFRELRKTVPQKTARYFRLAKEFGKSDRQIARIVDGID